MALMNRKLRHDGGDGVHDAARAVHVHLLAPHQGGRLARRARHRHGAAGRRGAARPQKFSRKVGSPMLADRLKTLAPSPTLAMQAKAKAMRAQGIDVISFGAGEPDFDTPEPHQGRRDPRDRAGPDQVHRGRAASPSSAPPSATSSSATTGSTTRPTRSPSRAAPSTRSTTSCMALVNPGDEVLIPSPYWVSYPEQVRLLGGVPVPVRHARVDRLRPRPGRAPPRGHARGRR